MARHPHKFTAISRHNLLERTTPNRRIVGLGVRVDGFSKTATIRWGPFVVGLEAELRPKT